MPYDKNMQLMPLHVCRVRGEPNRAGLWCADCSMPICSDACARDEEHVKPCAEVRSLVALWRRATVVPTTAPALLLAASPEALLLFVQKMCNELGAKRFLDAAAPAFRDLMKRKFGVELDDPNWFLGSLANACALGGSHVSEQFSPDSDARRTLATIVKDVNAQLSTCGKQFAVVVVDKDGVNDVIVPMMKANNDCHDVGNVLRSHEVVALIDVRTQKAAAYLSFSWHSQAGGIVFMEFGCTDAPYRRTGASQVLRCGVIWFAIAAGAHYVVSNANKASGTLLREKFGFAFASEDEYDLAIGNATNWEVSATAVLDLRTADASKFGAVTEQIIRCDLPK